MNPELHLGVTPWRMGRALEAGSLCRQAEQAEAWGFDSFFLPESHFVATGPIPDPLLLLAAVAGRTRQLLLGTTSYLLPIRNPLLAAEQVASLDQLCNGRLILGLGRGYQRAMLDAFGVNAGDKRARFEATLDLMLAAWRGEPIGDGDHGLTLSPLPQQQPHPPLWVAAFGPKAIAQCGRLGLPYLASPMESFTELRANFAAHREALVENGQAAPQTVAIMRTVFISENEGRVAQVRDKLAASLANAPASALRRDRDIDPDDWCLLGNAEQVARQIQDHREALGVTHLIAVRPRVSGIEESWLVESLAALACCRGA